MKNHKLRLRTCIATREKLPQEKLIRIAKVKTENGYKIVVARDTKVGGRGVYIKPDLELFEIALEKEMFKWNLRLQRNITDEEKDELRSEVIKELESVS